MILAEIVHLIRQFLRLLQRNAWYAINTAETYNPTLNMALQLNVLECTTLMLVNTGIISQRGINTVQRLFNWIPILLEQTVECGRHNVKVKQRRGHPNMVAATE
jgi:hypothetical protein